MECLDGRLQIGVRRGHAIDILINTLFKLLNPWHIDVQLHFSAGRIDIAIDQSRLLLPASKQEIGTADVGRRFLI
jgi:hypothetical protein